MKQLEWLLLVVSVTLVTGTTGETALIVEAARGVFQFIAGLISGEDDFSKIPDKVLNYIGRLSSFLAESPVNGTDDNLKMIIQNMNAQFDKLSNQIDIGVNDIKAFVDSKHFESDITNPTTSYAMEFQHHPSNESKSKLINRCQQGTPRDVIIKIENCLYSSDNTLEVQVRASKFEDPAFQEARKMIEYRVFQLMTLEAVCRGVIHGPNATMGSDIPMTIMRGKFDRIVDRIERVDRWRKLGDNLPYVEAIMTQELDKGTGSNDDITRRILHSLDTKYPWDKWLVVVFDEEAGPFEPFAKTNGRFSFHEKSGKPKYVLNHDGKNAVVYKSAGSNLGETFRAKRTELLDIIHYEYGWHTNNARNVLEKTRKEFVPLFGGIVKRYDDESSTIGCQCTDDSAGACLWASKDNLVDLPWDGIKEVLYVAGF